MVFTYMLLVGHESSVNHKSVCSFEIFLFFVNGKLSLFRFFAFYFEYLSLKKILCFSSYLHLFMASSLHVFASIVFGRAYIT